MAFELDLQDKHLHLTTPLPPEECARRITAAIDHDLAVASVNKELNGTHDLIGHAEGGALSLRVRFPSSYSFYGALFKPVLTGVIKPHEKGALIEGDFAPSGFARAFVKVFCWSVLGFLSLMFVLVLARMAMGTALPGSWWGLVALPLAVAAGYGYSRLVKKHAQSDIAIVMRFVRDTVEPRSA